MVDEFNKLIMDVFNLGSGNMLQMGNVLRMSGLLSLSSLILKNGEPMPKGGVNLSMWTIADGDGTKARYFGWHPI